MKKYRFNFISTSGNHTWVNVLAESQVEAESKIEKYLPHAMDVELVEETTADE
jgi:hypothetical protein